MEEVDNEQEYKRSKDRSPSPGVKSTAVVKYTAFQSPVGYARLQCNTDLNLPPSNWGAAIDSYGLKQILTSGTGLSSFRMAHMFPDCVGEVDVISGAECIKKLLKLPYQPNGTVSFLAASEPFVKVLQGTEKKALHYMKSKDEDKIIYSETRHLQVSMMVHRVENTLLVDDFDVYDYLMKSEWSWLKDFFYENILKTMSEKERMMVTSRSAPSPALLTRSFLSHSVLPAPAAQRPPLPSTHIPPGPFLPEPETKYEEIPKEHLYNRNVLWTFEDIHMLIGSDLPIFGDKDRPCVSLRLRDTKDPINVLTGIDYWLDNLMCNVPEVLMCYHHDGIVQKYEPMKTEDLPNMENSRFSPKVVRNVAQNILSFLKANATKAGHTYWLFKGPQDEIVKLYDLSSLCPDNLDNPFTTPVAMLLYRVARNMRLTNRSRHVKQLLEHVIELLKVERHPQIVASSHYMLADLYVPATTNPACPDFKEECSDSDNEDPDYAKCAEFMKDLSSERDDNTSENVCESDGDIDKDVCENIEKNANDDDIDKDDCVNIDNNDNKGVTGDDDGEEVNCEEEVEKINDSEGGEVDSNKLALLTRGLALNNIGDRVKSKKGDKKSSGSSNKLGSGAADRCGRALTHALRGLLALHNVTMRKCQEEERERLKQQIIIEEQHPKMANPFEPIKMDYEPISNTQNQRGRRRKRERKNTEKSPNCLIETPPGVDKNAILIHKEKKSFPTWQEPNRDDNFAWKLHLKTLLYEKICLAYATLAEFSYANEQYGFSLKYIDLASKCQKLLSNMIIKSRVVDASCLIGRVGDNFFQLSKHWHRLEQFRKQFETDHDIDSKLRLEIENDMAEEVDGVAGDEFDLDLSLPSNETDSMLLSCTYYRRALQAANDKREELLRRLASVNNELAVRYMNDGQQIYMKYVEEENKKLPSAKLLLKQFTSTSRRSAECLDEATAIFQRVKDVPNLALLYCNKARYMRFKAHCDQGGFNTDKRVLYSQAEELYTTALKLLGSRETCGALAVWELVSWELSCHLYTRAVFMQDCPRANEVNEVAEAFRHALKHCHLSPGPRQYLYQFRAAMIYHRLGSLYHSQYRITTEDGPKRRTLFTLTRSNYEQAANMFASLEDASTYLTVQMEHVAVLEAQATVTPNLKLKSLQSAIQLLRQCHSIMKLIKERDPDQKETPKSDDADEKSLKNEHSLLSLYESRLHFILKSIIQYCRSKSNKDYEKMTDVYKKLYCASLKIKKDEDVRLYAGSICDVLVAMDEICKEFE